MRDVVADTGYFADQRFNIAKHSIDANGQLVERITASARWQALTQITGNDALDSSIDFRDSILSTLAQYHSDDHRQHKCRQQSQNKCLPDDVRDLDDLVDVAADHKDMAVWQEVRNNPHSLKLAAAAVEAKDRDAGRDFRPQPGRQTFNIALNVAAVGIEEARDPDPAGILPQPPFGSTCRDDIEFLGEQAIDPRRHVGGGVPIDKAEQHKNAQNKRARDGERPPKRGRASKIRQAHGA